MPAVTVDDVRALPVIGRRPTAVTEGRWARSPPPRPASRARASPSAGPSPASTCATSTRSSTWTRWARSSTRPGEPKGTPWHPHRGFETVTYMIDGTFEHQDSNGGGGLITNGDTQWMTAGGGILHIETPPEALVASGGLFHGVQLWVNLPTADKMVAARATRTSRGQRRCLLGLARRRRAVRVIAGDVAGHAGPGLTYTPIAMVHATVPPGRQARPALAAPTSTPWSTCSAARARVGAERPPGAHRPAGRARRRRHDHGGRRRRSQERAPRPWTCSSSAVCRSASRSRSTARS